MKKFLIISLTILLFLNFALVAKGSKEQSGDTVTLNILSHPVHKKVTEDSEGSNSILDAWVASESAVNSVVWNTYDIDPLRDRLFRECSLPSTKIDVSYALN